MTLRRFVLVSHQWLGLLFAGLLALLGVTGAMLVWPDQTPFSYPAGVLHDSLMLGRAGWLVILLSTCAGVALQAGGVILWWRTRRLSIRWRSGLWRFAYDLHGALGILGSVMMLILAVSGIGRAALPYLVEGGSKSPIRILFSRVHTTEGLPVALKVMFLVASLGFVAQAVTGLIVWWRPLPPSASAPGA